MPKILIVEDDRDLNRSVCLYLNNCGYVQIEIADNGCGMNEETVKHIFEKFYQGDTSRSTQGNGLGLAIVKRIVDILKGKITVESKLNEGSRFTITLKSN